MLLRSPGSRGRPPAQRQRRPMASVAVAAPSTVWRASGTAQKVASASLAWRPRSHHTVASPCRRPGGQESSTSPVLTWLWASSRGSYGPRTRLEGPLRPGRAGPLRPGAASSLPGLRPQASHSAALSDRVGQPPGGPQHPVPPLTRLCRCSSSGKTHTMEKLPSSRFTRAQGRPDIPVAEQLPLLSLPRTLVILRPTPRPHAAGAPLCRAAP